MNIRRRGSDATGMDAGRRQTRLDATHGRQVVFCHACLNEWYRNERAELTCPCCIGDVVEIISPGFDPRPASQIPEELQTPSRQNAQWAPELAHAHAHAHETVHMPTEDDQPISPSPPYEHEPWYPGPNGLYVGPNHAPRGLRRRLSGEAAMNDLAAGMQAFLEHILRDGSRPGAAPFQATFSLQRGQYGTIDIANHFNHAITNLPNGAGGLAPNLDAVYSQQAMDRIISQLMNQRGSDGPPPALASDIAALPIKKLDEEMLGPGGKGECSICMDDVEIGTEVVVLHCNHWFHKECASRWLNEHDTCPICRKAIGEATAVNDVPGASGFGRAGQAG
ncbi:hypothetical protein BJ878DRAFT_26008 [Calycina marina]|uniref:RING-type E3 ubiquitin transferase n=1 Tax=Calycina marina TaxID=1763456 RepID=A0A9P7ZAF7_9HELO|nr:hypothetical protein BJ878DRAFT_26008 [Calycina marina]